MSREAAALVAFTLERGERARVRIHGRSMLPTLVDGMTAEVEPLPASLQSGDILLYDTGGMLVAHRLITCLSDQRFMICGDANPKVVEHISRKRVLGRVTRVWQSEEPGAAEIPAWRLRLLGKAMLRSRALRATAERARELGNSLAQRKQTTAFASISLALMYFSHERWPDAVTLIDAFEPRYFFAIAARHGLGGILHRLFERSAAAGYPVRADYVEGVRAGRWMSALRSDEILARAREVQGVLAGKVAQPIFLKGAARLLRGDPDADLHFSSDVDLILPPHEADVAVELLRERGYDHHVGEAERRMYHRWRQHRAPLWNSDAVVPIELHIRLCIPGSVSKAYDYESLLPLSREIDSSAGRVRLLDAAGTALHLAYHGRDCRGLRDVYLLAEALRAMDASDYRRFMDLIGEERRDRVRLGSIVGLAHRFANMPFDMTAEHRRYLSWLTFREDLALVFQKRAHILEGIYARCLPPFQGAEHIRKHVYTWLYNAIATPLLASWYRRHHRTAATEWLGLLEQSERAELLQQR